MSRLDDVIAKVRRLYALAEGTNSEGEAQAAMAAAHKLIREHQLSEAELAAHGDPSATESASVAQEALYTFGRSTPQWEAALANVIATAYGCFAWTSRDPAGVRIAGRPSNVALARVQFERVRAQILHLSVTHCAGKGRSFATAYKVGLVCAVSDRLRPERSQGEPGTALAVVDLRTEAERAASRETGLVFKSSRGRKCNRDGFQDGKSHGNRVHFGEHVGAGATRLIGPRS